MIGIPIALLAANGVEWYLHKYALHCVPKEGGGRKSLSEAFMKRHWAHHRRVRLTKYRDDELYAHFNESPDAKAEAAALIKMCAVTSLAMPVAPFFTLTTYYCAWNYWHVHSQSHLDPEWGKKKIPWHYDHHMNTNQDANWGVTKPWFDYIMGTRVISSAAAVIGISISLAIRCGSRRAKTSLALIRREVISSTEMVAIFSALRGTMPCQPMGMPIILKPIKSSGANIIWMATTLVT